MTLRGIGITLAEEPQDISATSAKNRTERALKSREPTAFKNAVRAQILEDDEEDLFNNVPV